MVSRKETKGSAVKVPYVPVPVKYDDLHNTSPYDLDLETG